MKELLVRTPDPARLDQVVNQFGAVVVQDDTGAYESVMPQVYAVRMLNGNTGFLRFALTSQGYGLVVGERDA